MQSPTVPTFPTDLMVIGENRTDPELLLLFGDDGLYYAYSLVNDDLHQVDPDQQWQLTTAPPQDSCPRFRTWRS